jgi:hypothetical protein
MSDNLSRLDYKLSPLYSNWYNKYLGLDGWMGERLKPFILVLNGNFFRQVKHITLNSTSWNFLFKKKQTN